MKKKMNLTAIAVVMVTMTATWLTSCTADEYGDFAFGTLAEGMFTRSGDPGWGETTPTSDNKMTVYVLGKVFQFEIGGMRNAVTVDVSITVDTILNKATCNIDYYNCNTPLEINAEATKFDYNNKTCYLTLTIDSSYDGKIKVGEKVKYKTTKTNE